RCACRTRAEAAAGGRRERTTESKGGKRGKYNRLGESGLQVSELCLGTMTFGEQNDEREAHAQLDCAIAHGINFIDTAELYPVPPRAETACRTETIVGAWLRRQPRDKLIVASKIGDRDGATGCAAARPRSRAQTSSRRRKAAWRGCRRTI